MLKNRDYKTKDCSAAERDQAEGEFFSKGVWTTLPPTHVGITSLKPRLSSLLRDQILEELPNLIEDVTADARECEEILKRLGASRATLQEQRLHLLRVSQEFSSLARSTIDGMYIDRFFGSAMDDVGYSKRLRAVISNQCQEFADVMRRKGHAKQIVDKVSVSALGFLDQPPQISRSEYIGEVMTLMKRSRGCELPGTYNPLIVGNLFYEQSKNWGRVAEQYTRSILDATRDTLNAILEHTTDEATAEGLMRYIINPAMDALKQDLQAMVATVLEPHQRGHPITFNHYLTDNIQKAKAQHRKTSLTDQLDSFFGTNSGAGETLVKPRSFDVSSLLRALDQGTEADMDRYACSEAIDCMEAYYKVAIKTFVDDFSVLAVEKCLVKQLPELLSPRTVVTLDDAAVTQIAAETEESQLERSRATSKLGLLASALVVLRSLDRHKAVVNKPAEVPQPSTFGESSEEDSVIGSPENGPSDAEHELAESRCEDDSDDPVPATVPASEFHFGAPSAATVEWGNFPIQKGKKHQFPPHLRPRHH